MSATSPPSSAPKAMSSRLMTMKFMQRAAASSPISPSTSTPEEPPSKRRRKNDDSPIISSVHFDEAANRRALEQAEKEAETRRQAVLERQGIAAGDTRWVIAYPSQEKSSQTLALRVVETGYANLDIPLQVKIEDDESQFEDRPVMVGRRSFGNFNKTVEV